MKRLRLDFAAPTAAWGRRLGLLAALALLAASAMEYAEAHRELERLQADIAAVDSEASRAPVPTPPPERAEAQVQAINSAIAQLNVPWEKIFRLVEAAESKDVALLALEPDGKKHALLLQAEARTAEQMLAYVEVLRQLPEVDAAYLLKHELREQDPNHPYRYSVELRWREAL